MNRVTLDETTKQQRRRAEQEATKVMRQAARDRHPITYETLTQQITALSYRPNDAALTALLCEISRKEDLRGRGLLSAVVVRKDTHLPGDGFFEFAVRCGRHLEDPEDQEQQQTLWRTEVRRVFQGAKES